MVLSKYVVATIAACCFLFSLIILGLSFGFYLIIFIIVLIPAIIMQVYAGIKAFKRHPTYTLWILLSAFAFLGFSLLRPDADQHGAFSGYSSLMYHLGATESEHVEPWKFSLELSLLLILTQIFINTYILRGLGKIPK